MTNLKKLYYEMLRIRMIEEGIADHYPEQEMRCPVHLSIGQEGTAVGVCAALEKTDYMMSTHRAHAHYLAKGGALKPMIAEIYGKEDGCTSGKGGSMHLVDLEVGMLGSTPIVGSSLPVAVGTAFGSQLKGDEHISTVFFGEGSTEEGVFSESLNFSALKNLPMLFICEDNLYSVYSPLNVRQPQKRDLIALAKSHGVQAFHGDGNDIEATYDLAKMAVQKIRSGEGPVLLELDTYRWREHCGPFYDNNIGYRSEEEFLHWKEKCPLKRCKEKLLAAGAMDEAEEQDIRATIQREVDEAFDFAKSSSFPPVGNMA
jgi:TPP-dependent pyruvate/acetoin dehydrogenase alpha subunit